MAYFWWFEVHGSKSPLHPFWYPFNHVRLYFTWLKVASYNTYVFSLFICVKIILTPFYHNVCISINDLKFTLISVYNFISLYIFCILNSVFLIYKYRHYLINWISIIDITFNIKNIKNLRTPHCSTFVEENILFCNLLSNIHIFRGSAPQ